MKNNVVFMVLYVQNTIHVNDVTVAVSGYMMQDFLQSMFDDSLCQVMWHIQLFKKKQLVRLDSTFKDVWENYRN